MDLSEANFESLRQVAPRLRQAEVRKCADLLLPHYRLALEILAICEERPQEAGEIARRAGIHSGLALRVLKTLAEGNYAFRAVGSTWQSARTEWWQGPRHELELHTKPRTRQELCEYTPSQLSELAGHLGCQVRPPGRKAQLIAALLQFYHHRLSLYRDRIWSGAKARWRLPQPGLSSPSPKATGIGGSQRSSNSRSPSFGPDQNPCQCARRTCPLGV